MSKPPTVVDIRWIDELRFSATSDKAAIIIDSAGLATLDKVAAAGVAGGSDDGKPVLDVTIKSVQVG